MKRTRLALVAGLALAAASTLALAAGNYGTWPIVGGAAFCAGTTSSTVGGTGTICSTNVPAGPSFLTGSELVPMDTVQAAGAPPQSVVAPASLLGNFSGFQRNYLDNGSMNVQQRGTGTVTCGTTTVPSTAYGPDRWGCHANVGSGAGRQAIVTTAALLPTGFASVNTVWRLSGALTQPVCSTQIIPTVSAQALAGKTVTLSVYAAALAGLSADNGNVITGTIFTGTGSDQGFGTLTASPAITPAWTGLTTPLSQSAVTITTTPTRYSFPATAIPATATEVGVAICFTPTATGAGATDGFAFTGAQLEVAPSASAYEFRPYPYDLERAQRYFYRLSESAAITPVAPCSAVDTTHTNCLLQFPQTMRAAPTMTYTAGFASPTSTTQATLGACSAIATATTVTSTVANPLNVLVNCTATTIPAAGIASFLYSNGGSGVISASADF